MKTATPASGSVAGPHPATRSCFSLWERGSRPLLILALGLGFATGCSPPSSPEAEAKLLPVSLKEPVRFTAAQRSSTPLPGSNHRLVLTIDDITRNQVMVSVAWDNGTVALGTRSLQPGETARFSVEGQECHLRLVRLQNLLVGTDRAELELSTPTAAVSSPTTEDARIDALIDSLEQLRGARFERNGQNYTLAEAQSHLRQKWELHRGAIASAEDFVRLVASKSSLSGDPYVIHLPDGRDLAAERWFRDQLDGAGPSPGE